MYGSTMFMILVLDQPLTDRRLWGTVGLSPGTANLAGGMATSGSMTSWLREVAGGVPFDDLVAEAAEVSPGADALVVLPYLAGERTPLFDADARGVICGLTLRHGRGHLYRALLEATGYSVRHHLEVMREAGADFKRVVAVGGGTAGGLWTQIVSDVTGQPQQLPEQTIGASYGDALLAARAAGLAGSDTEWSRIATTVEQDEQAARAYPPLYDIYRQLYPATREQVHRLAGLQGEELVS
jgi:xylulokinase